MPFNPFDTQQNPGEFADTESPKTKIMEEQLPTHLEIEKVDGLTEVEQADLDALNKTIPLYQATIASIEKYSIRDEDGKIPEGEDRTIMEELKGRLKLAVKRKGELLGTKIGAAESTITAEWWDSNPENTGKSNIDNTTPEVSTTE
jgi:hypothetical protein